MAAPKATNKTTIKPFDPNKAFAWSYSKVKNYESCPNRHLHADIIRDFPDEEGEALLWGNQVHDALARAVGNVGGKCPDGSDARPLKEAFKQFQPQVDERIAMRAKGADVATELDLAITPDFKPTGWFSRDAWFRAKVDVCTTYEAVAVIDDYKTGKIVDDSPQLRMAGIAVLVHFPHIMRVVSRFEWLKHDSKTTEVIDRKDMMGIWNAIAPRVERLRVAYANPDTAKGFPPKPGALCRRYCPVRSCQYHGV